MLNANLLRKRSPVKAEGADGICHLSARHGDTRVQESPRGTDDLCPNQTAQGVAFEKVPNDLRTMYDH